MTKSNSKWLLVAVLTTTLLAACGGGGGLGNTGGGQAQQAPDPSTSAQGVVDFLLALFASGTTDLDDPIPTDTITFATEELADPSPL